MKKTIALCLAFTGLMIAGGCATPVRYVTAQHWHDDDTFFVAYSSYDRTNFVFFSGASSSTARVLMCKVDGSNAADCRPQVAVDRLLNPDEDYPDAPPPPAVEPEPAPDAEADGAATDGADEDVM